MTFLPVILTHICVVGAVQTSTLIIDIIVVSDHYADGFWWHNIYVCIVGIGHYVDGFCWFLCVCILSPYLECEINKYKYQTQSVIKKVRIFTINRTLGYYYK